MAEYKGLTIRIGGDTSQLNAALKGSTKAASALQSQIRQITRAMKFDPSDFGNLNTRVHLAANRMEALYSKLKLVRNGYAELGKQVVTVGGAATSVKELAKATQNVEMAAKAADKRYDDVTASLAAMYREFEKLGTASIKRALNLDEASPEIKAIIDKFRELGIITKDVAKGVDRIKLDLSDAGRAADIDELLADMRTLGAVTDEQIASNRLMRETFKEALGNKEAYDMAAQYKKMGVDMQRIRSEAESTAASMRQMSTVSKYSQNAWAESTAKIKSMDSALSEAAKRAQTFESALRQNPANLDAAVGRLRTLADQYDLAKQKAKELETRVKVYEDKLSGTLAKQKNLTSYIQDTGDEWQRVQTELGEAKGKADALHQSLQRLKDAQAPVEEIKQLEAAVREADAKVDALNADAAKMDEKFETAKECAELQQLQAELAQTETKVATLGEAMSRKSMSGTSLLSPSTVKSLGMTLYSTLTPALTMVGWRMVTAAEDIDSAYRDMRKTVDGTEEQFESLKQAAIDFSETHVTSADQLMNIMAIGGELGIATDSLLAFSETVSNLDVATNLETEEAAESLGKLANITHMGADEYDNYADALVRLGNNGASTEDQIVGIATRIGSMGTIVGMSVPEILALSSSIAATGMKTEAAGTAISNTFSDIESAVHGAEDDLYMFAQVAGMSSEEFAQSWEEHPIEAFRAFIEGLNEVEAEGGSAVSTLADLGITGERQKQAILGLMQTIGGLNDNLLMSNDAWDGVSDQWGAAGDAAREAEKKAEGFSGQLQILKNTANDALAELAEGATPLIKQFNDLAKTALDAFKGMSDESKTAVVKLMAIGVAIGPVLTLAATLMTAHGNMMKFVRGADAISKAAKVMSKGAGGAETAVKGLVGFGSKAGLYGLAAAAVVAAGALGYKAYTDYKKAVEDTELAVDGFLKAETEGFAEAQGGVENNVNSTRDRINELKETITDTADMVRGWQDQWKELGTEKGKLDYYMEVMDELAGRTDLTKGQQQELNDAVKHYNEITGDTVTLDENFNLSKTRDELKQTADEWYNLVAAQQYQQQAEDLIEQKAEIEQQAKHKAQDIAAAEKKVEEAEAELERTPKRNNSTEYKRAQQAVSNAKKEVADLTGEYEILDATLNGYNDTLNELYDRQTVVNQSMLSSILGNGQLAYKLDEAGVSAADFSDYLSALGANAETVGTLTGNSADNLVNSYQYISTIAEELGTTTADLTTAMKDAGITTADLAAVGVENFAQFYEEAGGDMDLLKEKIDEYKSKDIENEAELDTKDANEAMTELDARELRDKLADATIYNTPALNAIQRVNDAPLNNKTATIKAKDRASSVLANIQYAISQIKSKTVTITARQVGNLFGGSATGSIADSPYIPRHASGYVAFGPTLTNNGWVGEDGAEAVLNWGTGGAVIPLTNHRYMEPIAHEIARSLAPLLESGGSGGSTNVYLNDVRVNDAPGIRDATKEYLLELNRLAVI